MKALVTGGTYGIGKEISDHLLSKGYHVTIIARNCHNKFSSPNIEYIPADLSKTDEIKRVIGLLDNKYYSLLINNAGGAVPKKLKELDIECFTEDLNLNLIAPFFFIQCCIKKMIEHNFGRIINISSIAARTGVPYLHSYGAAKSGLINITQSISKELVNGNITINAICPGGIATDTSIEKRNLLSRFLEVSENDKNHYMSNHNSLGRLISTKEILPLIDFLISNENSAFKGQSINICGTLEMS